MSYRSRNEVYRQTWMDPYGLLAEHERYQPIRDALLDEGENDEVYLEKMKNLFSCSMYYGVPPTPTLISNNVFLGTQSNAENLDILKRMHITHVLNCAGLPESLRHARARRYKGTGITYDELPMDDNEDFNIMGYFGRAHAFIESGRVRGNVLIHCTGVSRSGAIAIAYLLRSGKRLLASCRALKDDRRVVLCNEGFMKQLVQYARATGSLDLDVANIKVGKYGRKLDRARILQAHLPDYLNGK